MNRILRSFQSAFLVLAGIMAAATLHAQVQLQVSPSALVFSALPSSPPQSQSISVSSSGDMLGQHISYTAFVQSTSPQTTTWLTLAGTSGTTPGTITVSVVPGSLPEGLYSAQILIGASGTAGNSPQLIPVSFTIAQIAASPAALSFAYQAGGVLPQPQGVLVTGPEVSVTFTAAVATSTGGDWLEVGPTSASTPGTVTAGLNSAVAGTLAAGTYSGALSLLATGDSTVVTVPVTLTVTNTSQVNVSPSSFYFGYQIGGTNNVTQQNLNVTSSASPVTFTAVAATDPNSAGVDWLVLSSLAPNVTPVTLTVGVAPASLPPGNYFGQVSILVGGTAVATLPVTLTVSASPLISLSPTTLNFSYQTGGAAPPAQSVSISSTSTSLNYSVFPSTTSGGNWLEAVSGGTTPNPISVSVDPTGLGAGIYSGKVMVSADNAANSPQVIAVTLTVTAFPLIEASPASLNFVYQTGESSPPGQVIAVSSSTGAPLDFSVASSTNSGGSWLSAGSFTGVTPGPATVSVATAGMAPGTYTGSVNISATNSSGVTAPNSPLAVPVTYYVSNDPLLSVSPGALTFTAEAGTTTNGQKVVLTSTSSPLEYSVTTSTPSSGPWLLVAAPPGSTPNSFEVYASADALSPGAYNGSINIGVTNPAGPAVADNPMVIPVTFQVTAGTLTAAPSALTFNQTLGGSLPVSQSVKLSTGSQSLNFTAVASNSSGVNWLTVTPSSGVTPATLTVSADGSNLSAGTYAGVITVTVPNASGSPLTLQVTLTVTAAASITLTPATLQFSAQAGGPAPATQTIAVTASTGSLTFTAAAAVAANSPGWLGVTPASGTTPGTLTVSVNPTGLAAGKYTGTITVTATGAGISPQSVNVTLTVNLPPTPLPTSVQSAASQFPGAVAPGEIISIYGTNLGPATGVGPVISDNTVATSVSGVQVMFGNNAAPLLYVSATQINAVVPFELNGQVQTQMEVSYYGAVSATTALVVAPTAPALFTLAENGTGPAAALNAAGGVNSSSNPAPEGSVVVLFATGGGETSPPGVTGNITPNNGTGLKIVQGVGVTVGNLPCTVLYAGSAPGFIEGALQINAQLPGDVPSGAQPVVVTIGGASSPSGVTVAIQ